MGECDINQCISSFTAVVQNVSFACFGKTVTTHTNDKQRKHKKSLWFDAKCRDAKNRFFRSKTHF